MAHNLDERLEREIISTARRFGVKKLILFGSRARGDNHKRSDIDLAVSGGNFDDFALAVEEIDTLLLFDVVYLDGNIDADFQDEIDRDGVVLFEEVPAVMKKFERFCKALTILNEADAARAGELIYRVGIIRWFEICFEQAWKLMKELLENHSLYPDKIASPRAIIKISYQYGMIDDEETWLEIQKTRNLLAHTYSEEDSLQAVEKIKASYVETFLKLKAEVEQNWLNESPLDNRRGDDGKQD